MRKENLPEELRRRVEALETNTGRLVVLRGAHWPDPGLRGRLSQRAGAIVLEYRDDVAGFFWHYDLIAELLDHAERGHLEATLRDSEARKLEDLPRLGIEE